ncbi:hypothetical protein PFMC_00767 [Plasmodium falciparum CAMP/Malaysia]|uniref:Uncharacterized protein n=1 Tax=Plasmodium falciparum (isolate Camp / Malaysia) TaxID=5835 RepID=A0A024XDW4_PLAFC|nr:hypothetical protein PFMC_00767 [Plasmodium falciparum CAMP/Malaysia]
MFVGKTKRELNQTCQNKFEGAISVDNNVNIYCKNKLDEYRNWDVHRKNQWDGSKENYKKHKENNGFSGKQPNEQNTKAYFFENFVENVTRMAKIAVNQIHPNPKELVANLLEKIVCGTMDVAARINKC